MILATIVEEKKQELARLKRQGIAPPDLEPPPPRGFARALNGEGMAVIAEVKKASPSKGIIRADFDPVAIARSYTDAGAAAISVLTDRKFFQGDLAYLARIRAAIALPVLRKDFIIDALQIEEARAHGADAVLLIAAILDSHQLKDYRQMAAALDMDSLVEVHDEAELERTLASGATLVGINNRNLQTFVVDLAVTFRLKALVPGHIPVVSESGIRNREDMLALQGAGLAAVLVGETLMRAPDPGAALCLLRGL